MILDRKFRNKKLINRTILNYQPDLLAFTAVNTEIDYILEIAGYIKKRYNIFSVLGGIHVTLNASGVYLHTFDALCIGEGEFPLLELADKQDRNEDINSIANLWVKYGKKPKINPPRAFIQDLDEIPFVDREIWQPWILDKKSRLTILVGRGCPYNCTYCCNHSLKKITSGKYVRLRSAESILAEIKELQDSFPEVLEYYLEIETLGVNINWLESLCNILYEYNSHKDKKLFFGANLRVNDNMELERVFMNLGKANFSSVTIGLESGSERVRKEILNRNYSNDTIIKAVKTARKYGIKVGLFNIMGIPSETYKEFKETLRMNQLLQPDWHATSIFYPYEGTALYKKAKDEGFLPASIPTAHERQFALLDLQDFPRKKIQQEFDSFHFNVYKKNPTKNNLKLMLYFFQKLVGHNFMANAKIKIIALLYRFRLKTTLVSIFQKL